MVSFEQVFSSMGRLMDVIIDWVFTLPTILQWIVFIVGLVFLFYVTTWWAGRWGDK